jgi:hypothetical protein
MSRQSNSCCEAGPLIACKWTRPEERSCPRAKPRCVRIDSRATRRSRERPRARASLAPTCALASSRRTANMHPPNVCTPPYARARGVSRAARRADEGARARGSLAPTCALPHRAALHEQARACTLEHPSAHASLVPVRPPRAQLGACARRRCALRTQSPAAHPQGCAPAAAKPTQGGACARRRSRGRRTCAAHPRGGIHFALAVGLTSDSCGSQCLALGSGQRGRDAPFPGVGVRGGRARHAVLCRPFGSVRAGATRHARPPGRAGPIGRFAYGAPENLRDSAFRRRITKKTWVSRRRLVPRFLIGWRRHEARL